ncbi:DoxX family protein [Arcicella rosea]|uniref:DoxX-like family protein n=1 Tax=Arcicella rosea TaxID=502909 RepID=A0A841EUC0_9BACT|nr:DoxX family protein [Arcicella rosea]MBB6003041.1 hypothetical protein [Arcicella rosea]
MKTTKITFWISTSLIFLFMGVMPALTGHTEMAKEGTRHLGYPQYFGMALNIFKIIGSLALIIPQVPKVLKEWAYAGFVFDIIFATISLWAVDGFNAMLLVPVLVMAVLLVSYFSFHKLQSSKS